MKTRAGKWLLVTGALFGLAVFLYQRPLRIEFHRGFVRDGRWAALQPPKSWKGYLSPVYLRWRIQGQPDWEKRRERAREHENALVRMGYFERRVYYPTNYSPFWVRHIRTNAIKDDLMFFSGSEDGKVEVLAHKEDFPLIERMLRELEAAGPWKGEFE